MTGRQVDTELEEAFAAIRGSSMNVGYYDRERSIFSTEGGYEDIFVPQSQTHAVDELLRLVRGAGIPHGHPRQWRVLDVGCSIGSATFALAPRVREAVGTDIEPATVAAAEIWRRKRGIGNVSFKVVDGATGEGMPEGKFDLIILKEVAEHVGTPERLLGMLRDLRGRLEPGGALLLETPNYLIPFEPHLRMIMPPLAPRWMINALARMLGKGGPGHRLFMESLLVQSPHRIARLAREAGFAVRDLGAEVLLPWVLDGTRSPRGDLAFLAPLVRAISSGPLRRIAIRIARLAHAWPTTMFLLAPVAGPRDGKSY